MNSIFFILLTFITFSHQKTQSEDEIQTIFATNLKIINEKTEMLSEIWSSRTSSDKSTCELVQENTKLWTPAIQVILNAKPFKDLAEIFDNHNQSWTELIDRVKKAVGHYPAALDVDCSGFFGGMFTTNGILLVKYVLMGDRTEFREAISNLGQIDEVLKVHEYVRKNMAVLDEIRCHSDVKKVYELIERETCLNFDNDIFGMFMRIVGADDYANKC